MPLSDPGRAPSPIFVIWSVVSLERLAEVERIGRKWDGGHHSVPSFFSRFCSFRPGSQQAWKSSGELTYGLNHRQSLQTSKLVHLGCLPYGQSCLNSFLENAIISKLIFIAILASRGFIQELKQLPGEDVNWGSESVPQLQCPYHHPLIRGDKGIWEPTDWEFSALLEKYPMFGFKTKISTYQQLGKLLTSLSISSF